MLEEGLCRFTKLIDCWWFPSRGGEMGSLLILTESGDEDGGGVLLLTDKCGKPELVDGLIK